MGVGGIYATAFGDHLAYDTCYAKGGACRLYCLPTSALENWWIFPRDILKFTNLVQIKCLILATHQFVTQPYVTVTLQYFKKIEDTLTDQNSG